MTYAYKLALYSEEGPAPIGVQITNLLYVGGWEHPQWQAEVVINEAEGTWRQWVIFSADSPPVDACEIEYTFTLSDGSRSYAYSMCAVSGPHLVPLSRLEELAMLLVEDGGSVPVRDAFRRVLPVYATEP